MMDFPDIDGIILSMAVKMTFEERQDFGRHLMALVNDILLVPVDDTEAKLKNYIHNNEGHTND